MGSSIKIGRIFGIDIGIHWSWIFIFFIVTWSFAIGVFEEFYPDWSLSQRWIGGAFVSIVFFLSVLAHELSHAIVSNRNGLPVRSITLFVFGGVANLSEEPDNPRLEFQIAVVGPLTSFALGAGFAVLWVVFRTANEGVAGICANLALINVMLAVFNLLPGFPLDGGRVFRSIAWSRNGNRLRATRTASMVGEWIAYGLMGLGVIQTFFLGVAGLWLLLIGFFLKNAAQSSYEQLLLESTLSGIPVKDVMRRTLHTVPPEVTVEQLVHDYVLRENARTYAVMAAGDFAGLITLADIRKLPRERWSELSVYRAMTPANVLHSVSPDEDLSRVLQIMAEYDVNQLPVVEGRELVGMLDRGDVMRFVQLRRDLNDGMVARGKDASTEETREQVGAGRP